jgi:hypothetical protein
MGKSKILAGIALGLTGSACWAQNAITFDVVFDKVYEASGNFVPATTVATDATHPAPNLTAHVVLTAVASGVALTGTNTITLNGSYSSGSKFQPNNTTATYTFNNATFDLYKAGEQFAINLAGTAQSVNDWPAFIATALNGLLSDHGPAALYGGTCPFTFGCGSAQAAGASPAQPAVSPTDGTGIWAAATKVFDTTTQSANFAPLKDAGTYPLLSGVADEVDNVQPNSFPGNLGAQNGLDAFMFAGVLDTAHGSQPYIQGNAKGYPAIVRIMQVSATGNTDYVVEGHIVAPVPVPAAAWLFGSALGLLGFRRRAA